MNKLGSGSPGYVDPNYPVPYISKSRYFGKPEEPEKWWLLPVIMLLIPIAIVATFVTKGDPR